MALCFLFLSRCDPLYSLIQNLCGGHGQDLGSLQRDSRVGFHQVVSELLVGYMALTERQDSDRNLSG